MKWFYEIVIGSKRKRGKLIPDDKLFNNVVDYGCENEIFKSVFMYPEDRIEEIIKNKSISNVFCSRFAYWIPVDIDKGDNSDQLTLQNARNALMSLYDNDLTENNVFIWYSGTGYHIDIHSGCFGIEPQEDYPFLIKQTMKEILPFADLSIYTRSSIIRAPFSRNLKSNRYKIPLSGNELMSLSAEEIITLASSVEEVQKRISWFISESESKYGEEELKRLVTLHIPDVRTMDNVLEPSKIVTCIHKIWEQGPQQGSRNHTVMRLASHFRRSGFPSEAAKAAILYWNNKSLDEKIILEKVEYTYNKGYQYGCSDPILKNLCHTSCQHFKNKDLTVDLLSSNDMQKSLKNRLMEDFTKRVIHLDKMLGLPETSDCKIYPGELVTIFGLPGGNKSTLAQCLMMGVDFETGIPNPNYQLPAHYFHSELADWITHRRHLQIASGLLKHELTADNVDTIYRDNKSLIDHIQVVVKPATLTLIEKSIKESTAELIVIDYIETIDTEDNLQDQAKIKRIMQRLASLAVTCDKIVIAVSQVNREYAKEGILDLYAGFGSGSIEKSSRKVIGITAEPNSFVRKLEMFKNQDGNLFETKLEFLPNWRLRSL